MGKAWLKQTKEIPDLLLCKINTIAECNPKNIAYMYTILIANKNMRASYSVPLHPASNRERSVRFTLPAQKVPVTERQGKGLQHL